MAWAVIIGIVILLLAVLISYWVFVVIEDEHHFLYIIGGFLALFIVGTAVCFQLLPELKGKSNVGQLVEDWIQPGPAAQAEGNELPLLK